MKRDERGARFFHEDVPLSRYLEAIEKGETPRADDLQRVGKMASRYLNHERRPKVRGASSQWEKRMPFFCQIEDMRNGGATREEAIRQVFTSVNGDFDHKKFDLYMYYYVDGKRGGEIVLARLALQIRDRSKQFSELLPPMPKLPVFKLPASSLEKFAKRLQSTMKSGTRDK
jgi:hypothetical protein